MTVVYFKGSRQQARELIRQVVDQVTGKSEDVYGVAKSVSTAIGWAALSDIKESFVRKARGQVGEDGIRWPDLAPETKAYHRRFGPGEKTALKKAAGLGAKHRYAPGKKKGLLDAAQLKQWRKIYSSTLARLELSMPTAKAKAIAAGHAWNVMKAAGAKTMLEVYGSREVEILRDTGILFNSLSPGELTPSEPAFNYATPDEQVFQQFAGGVIVGTNVKYAGTHHRGDKRRGIPARPFWPDDGVPAVWAERWWDFGAQAVVMAIAYAVKFRR